MSKPTVSLPTIKLHRNKQYTYIFTYRGIWEPAIKDAQGNVIKKGCSRSVERKTIGKIVGGGDTGVISLYEEFLDSCPELKEYSVVRNADGSLTYNKISDLLANNPSDCEQIAELIKNRGYELDSDGKLKKSAKTPSKSASTTDVLESSFEAKRQVLSKRPNENAVKKQAGALLYLDHLSLKTGIRPALVKTFKQSAKVKAPDAIKCANYIETVVYNMLISGKNTYEELPKLYTEHAIASCVEGSLSKFVKYIAKIDEAFIEYFQKNFCQEYCKDNPNQALDLGIMVSVDGTPRELKNNNSLLSSIRYTEDSEPKQQLHVHFVCDANKNDMPLCYRLDDGTSNEVNTDSKLIQQLASYKVNLHKTCIVASRDYSSDEHLCSLLRNGHTFVLNCPIEASKEVQELINKAIAENIYTNISFVELSSGSKRCTSYTQSYSMADSKASAELKYHVFFDNNVHNLSVNKLCDELCALTLAVKQGEQLTPHQQELLNHYSSYDLRQYVAGKPNRAPELLSSKIQESTKYKGFQVLLTNDLSLNCALVLDIYNSRPQVEISIADIVYDNSEAKSDKGLQTKIFLEYLALILKAAIRQDLAQARQNSNVRHYEVPASPQVALDKLNSIMVNAYPSGIVCKPLNSKQESLLKLLSVPVPPSMR